MPLLAYQKSYSGSSPFSSPLVDRSFREHRPMEHSLLAEVISPALPLLAHAARGDRPHAFDSVSAYTKDAVIQIHRRVAVRNYEFDSIADVHRRRSFGQIQLAMLISAPREHQTADALRLRGERLVRRKRLQTAVNHRLLVRRLADDGRQHGQRILEIAIDIAVLPADPVVVNIHEDEAARLQFSDAVDLR